ncbi:MAG: metallophosphoesterase, partial [Turicibacter sp.]|nr:metallophosphoesterase [Turicibacter sp.]
MKRFFKRLGYLMFGCALIAIYSTFIEPKMLRAMHHEIALSKVAGEAIKVVQFSDTHVGEFFTVEELQKVVDKINEQEADLVLFTGDLMDNAAVYEGSIKEIASVLSKIESQYGKYAVFGNRDYGGGAERFYEELMESAGFTVLFNNHETLTIKGTTVSLFGADDAMIGYYDPIQTMVGINEDHLNLLMMHEPDLVDDFVNYPVDFVLAGHSHGGQVYIPFVGPIRTTALAEKYVRGLYEINQKMSLYVNTGIGNTAAPFRLFNIPEITVFYLT